MAKDIFDEIIEGNSDINTDARTFKIIDLPDNISVYRGKVKMLDDLNNALTQAYGMYKDPDAHHLHDNLRLGYRQAIDGVYDTFSSLQCNLNPSKPLFGVSDHLDDLNSFAKGFLENNDNDNAFEASSSIRHDVHDTLLSLDNALAFGLKKLSPEDRIVMESKAYSRGYNLSGDLDGDRYTLDTAIYAYDYCVGKLDKPDADAMKSMLTTDAAAFTILMGSVLRDTDRLRDIADNFKSESERLYEKDRLDGIEPGAARSELFAQHSEEYRSMLRSIGSGDSIADNNGPGYPG